MRSWKDYKFSDYILKKVEQNDSEFKDNKKYYEFGKKDFEHNTNDLFHSFYATNLKESDNPDAFFKKYMEIIKESKDFQDLKHRTEKNPAVAFIATKEFMHKMYEEYLKVAEKSKDENGDVDEQKMLDYMEENKSSIRQESREKIAEMKDKIEGAEMVEALTRSCGNEASTNQTIEQTEKILKYAQKLGRNKWFKQIIELAGRFQRSANQKLATLIPNIGTPIGVDIGNDLGKVLPQEFALMEMGGNYEDLFWLKWANSELMQYKTEIKQPQQDGPFIICIDESGSMDYQIAEAKAFMFGMFLIAKEKNRPIHVIRFDTQAVACGVDSIDDLIRIADQFLGGGTSFEAPLEKACEIIEKNEKFKKADIFFITDGCAHVSDEMKNRIEELKRKLEFKILALNLGYDGNSLRRFCDEIFNKNDKTKFFEECFSQ